MTLGLRALFSPGKQAEWAAWSVTDQIDQLRRHRLLPVALAWPEQQPFNGLIDSIRGAVMQSEHQRVADEQGLLARALPALAQRGCKALLLKGAALGRWLYSAAELRPCTDIDVLVDAPQRFAAHAAMLDAGLLADGYSQHDRASQQASYRDPHTRRQIDLHWAMNVLPELASRFDFDELWAQSQVLPDGVRVLSRKHALMHAVVHWCAQADPNARPSIWLYDIVLLTRGLSSAEWTDLDRCVRQAKLAGLHAHAMSEAQRWFPLELPNEMLQRWFELGQHECTRALLRGDRRPLPQLWHSLVCTPNWRVRWAYLRARLFPSPHWMRGRYAVRSGPALGLAYLKRWASGLGQIVRGSRP